MTKVALNRTILEWVLHRASLTLDDVEQKLPKVRQWASGEGQPTLRQVETLAKLTLTPLGFFFLDEPPEDRLPVPLFRTLDRGAPGRPSPELLETIQTMQRRQAWMREYLIEQGQEPLPFVRSARTDETPAVVGERIRSALRLAQGWAAEESTWTDALRVLRDSMEDAGIIVVANGVVGNNTHRTLNTDEFRGFVLVDEYAPLVFVNSTDGKAAQMFTLAHEVAHVFFGSSAAFDLREMQPASDPGEQACNRVAAEFLVPAQDIRRVWPAVRENPEPFQKLARQFKVSALVVARRALDLQIIDRDAFLTFYNEYLQDERRKATQGKRRADFYATQNMRVSRLFAHTIIRAAREGRVLYSEAYRLTGLYGKTFDGYAASLGMGGTRR